MLVKLLIIVKKADYNTKIAETEKKVLDRDYNNKCIITPEFNRLTADNFSPILAHAKLVTTAGIVDFAKETNSDNKLRNISKIVTSNKTKHVETEKKRADLTKKVP